MEMRPKVFDFHGVSMINMFTRDWERIQNFKARPEDILIATYPKAGRNNVLLPCRTGEDI